MDKFLRLSTLAVPKTYRCVCLPDVLSLVIMLTVSHTSLEEPGRYRLWLGQIGFLYPYLVRRRRL